MKLQWPKNKSLYSQKVFCKKALAEVSGSLLMRQNTADTTRPYCGGGSKRGCGNSSPVWTRSYNSECCLKNTSTVQIVVRAIKMILDMLI